MSTATSPDTSLGDNLKKARGASIDSPHHFALLPKGGSDGKLLVDRKKIAPAVVSAAKKEVGASAVVIGTLYYDQEGGEYVFLTKNPPNAAWVKLARTLAARDAKMTLKVRFDQKAGDDDEGDEAEGDEGGTPGAVVDPKAVADKLKALQLRVNALAGNPRAQQALAGELKAAATALQSGDAAKATELADRIAALLTSAERAAGAMKEVSLASPVRRAGFAKARDQWNQARTVARVQMGKLASAILADPEAQSEEDWPDIKACAESLVGALDGFDEALSEALGRANTEDPSAQKAALGDAVKLVVKYRGELANNPLYALTDSTAYGNFQAGALLTRALETVAEKLKS